MKDKIPYILVRESQARPIDPEKFFPILINDFKEKSTTDFYKEFCKFQLDAEVSIVPIIVNSYGGQLYEVAAMIDILSQSSKPVATIGLSKAMSCGAILLAAGTKGYRFAAPSADILIHEVSAGMGGKNADIQVEARNTDRLNKSMLKKLALYCGKKPDYFLNMIKANGNTDIYLNAKEAKKIGLVDHIGMPILLEK